MSLVQNDQLKFYGSRREPGSPLSSLVISFFKFSKANHYSIFQDCDKKLSHHSILLYTVSNFSYLWSTCTFCNISFEEYRNEEGLEYWYDHEEYYKWNFYFSALCYFAVCYVDFLPLNFLILSHHNWNFLIGSTKVCLIFTMELNYCRVNLISYIYFQTHLCEFYVDTTTKYFSDYTIVHQLHVE